LFTVILIGFVGGVVTAVSPCILPVLPVIFLSAGAPTGTGNRDTAHASVVDGEASATAACAKTARAQALRPYLVTAGLVASFGSVTLVGSALMMALHLSQDTIRWTGLVALTLIGVSLISPRVQHILERPFAFIPHTRIGVRSGGFGLGLALGVLYAPCAGPVLAAIVVAGATSHLDIQTITLTLAFALGAALPLLTFAVAGQRIVERVGAFRRRQRTIRVISGMVIIAFAISLVFNLTDVLQRAIPDYTRPLQDTLAASGQIPAPTNPGAAGASTGQPSNCTYGAPALANCGPAPDFTGITGWLNTPGDAGINLKSLRGKVVLVDFWTYSCINCQRTLPYVIDWYNRYRNAGFEVIGVHTPELAFEHVQRSVAARAAALGVAYPVALDNDYSTWNTYDNRYWPAEYLIDAEGNLRHITVGEGEYDLTDGFIRELLTTAQPGPAVGASANTTTPSPPVAGA
jgi:cytochrome c biogenesis protein CcdA/thiol-disulfide isomerase/thioredoxin